MAPGAMDGTRFYHMNAIDLEEEDKKELGVILHGLSLNTYRSARDRITALVKKYPMGRYEEIVHGRFFSKKKEVELLFAENNAAWILGFLNKDLTPKYSKFYSEYFSFVSSIMQYKIPFYITFYLSIFKLYISKEHADKLGEMDFQEKDIMIMFEEGELAKDYQPLTDYGIPMITINKFKKKDIKLNEIEGQFEGFEELDEYEKMMLVDFYRTI